MKISLFSTLSNDSHTNTLCNVDLSEVTFGERRIYCFCCCLLVCFFLRLEESSHMLITIFVYYYYYYYYWAWFKQTFKIKRNGERA